MQATHSTAGPVIPHTLGLVELRGMRQRDAQGDDRHHGDRLRLPGQERKDGNQSDHHEPVKARMSSTGICPVTNQPLNQ